MKKYFASLLIWRQNHSKFCRKINYNYYYQKSQIYHWVHKFQATGSVNNLNKKAENPRSGRKLTARFSDHVDAESEKVLLKTFLRTWSFIASLQRILKKDHQQYPYRIQIKHKLTPADMENVSVINHYHINGLYLFWDTLYIYIYTKK